MEQNLAISLKNVSVYQGDNLILSRVNLDVKKGEHVYMMGKTGSGKSSLLETLYGEIPFMEGEAWIADFDLKKIKRKQIPKLRRKLGIIFQDFQLLMDRTVKDNLLFVLHATGWDNRKKMDDRINEVLDKVGLQTKGFKMPHELSGGEQQRVAIARALLNHPEIVLADEPTGNLDPDTSEDIIKLLSGVTESDCAVIIATHNLVLVQKFPARTLRCENGEVVEDSSLSPIINAPIQTL